MCGHFFYVNFLYNSYTALFFYDQAYFTLTNKHGSCVSGVFWGIDFKICVQIKILCILVVIKLLYCDFGDVQAEIIPWSKLCIFKLTLFP